MTRHLVWPVLCGFLLPAAAGDYDRAFSLSDRFRDKATGLRVRANWSGQVRSRGAPREETEVVFVNESTSPVMLFWVTAGDDRRHLDRTDRLLWMSERGGWNHLCLVDRATGEARQLTKGTWVVRGIDHVDEEAGRVRFRMMGYDAGQDPYHVHHARINLDGHRNTGLWTSTAAFTPATRGSPSGSGQYRFETDDDR